MQLDRMAQLHKDMDIITACIVSESQPRTGVRQVCCSPFLRSGLTNRGSDSTVANATLLLGVISRRQIPRKPELAVDSAASGVAARLGVPGPPGKMRDRERTSVPVGSPLSPQSRSFRSLRP
jgi:hypothetical protein